MNRSGTEPLRPIDPARIGPYQLLGRLGEGGMGTVYLALAPTERPVAIKVVKPEFTVDSNFAVRFHAEVENARKVASFCTAQVLDNGNTEDGRPYMVTEYIPGTPLSAQIASFGALDPGPLHGVALGVAAALAAIHVAGLVHRDLKPSNVILSMSGPRVIDFGISRALDAASSFTQSGELLGSPGWWAPEQVRGDAITPAADIFAWGCLVAYAGNGRHPYGRGDALTLAARVLNTPPDLGALPVPLNDLARRATHPDPARRPNAQELLIALVSGGVPNPTPMPVEPATLVATEILNESWQPPANVADESASAGRPHPPVRPEPSAEPARARLTQALPAHAPEAAPDVDSTDGRVMHSGAGVTTGPHTNPGGGPRIGDDHGNPPDVQRGFLPDPATAPRRTPIPQNPQNPPIPQGQEGTVPGGATFPGAATMPGAATAPGGATVPGHATDPPGPSPYGPPAFGPPPGQRPFADMPTAAGALPVLDAPQKTDWRLVRKWLIPTVAIVAAIAVTVVVLVLGRGTPDRTVQAGGDNRFTGEQQVVDGPGTDVGRRVALGDTDAQVLIPQPPTCEADRCTVRLSLVNPSGVDIPIAQSPRLLDDQGGGHDLRGESTTLPESLAPGEKVDGVLVFDVPSDRKPAKLVLAGGIEVRL